MISRWVGRWRAEPLLTCQGGLIFAIRGGRLRGARSICLISILEPGPGEPFRSTNLLQLILGTLRFAA